jgi:hypothetical protein
MENLKMTFEKIPFYPTKLEEERKNRDQVNVDLTPELRKLVDEVKGRFNMPADASAMKIMLEVGGNAIKSTLSVDSWKRISDKERIRFTKTGQDELLK